LAEAAKLQEIINQLWRIERAVQGIAQEVAKPKVTVTPLPFRGVILPPSFPEQLTVANLLNPHPVLVNRQGVVTHFNVSLTAAGTSTVYTPSAGKKAKVTAWSLYSNADVVVELRFATSGKVIAGLPFKGSVAMNNLGNESPTGDTDEKVEIYGSGAVTVKGWICVVEV